MIYRHGEAVKVAELEDDLTDVLGRIRAKGVQLWSQDGQLRYKAPRGALSAEEVERLRQYRTQIVSLLDTARIRPRPRQIRGEEPRIVVAPLSFAQQAHWNQHQLREHRSCRQVATATRLHGALHVNMLQKSLKLVMQRHAALCTRITIVNDVPFQRVSKFDSCDLEVVDLSTLQQTDAEAEAERQMRQFILQPIDVCEDALFGVQLYRLPKDQHILLVAMEHIITDAFSVKLLLRDWLKLYRQVVRGCPADLPEIALQLPEFATWQRDAHDSWLKVNGRYWIENLQGCGRLAFPSHAERTSHVSDGWDSVPLHIDRALKRQLQEWCRARRTTLVMSVFAAFAALVLHSCEAQDGVIRYQTDGRFSPQVNNTIGYFASVLHLRVELLAEDSFPDLVRRLTGEYCRAYEHADLSFLDAQLPVHPYSRNSSFNWVPYSSARKLDWQDEEGLVASSPVFLVNTALGQNHRDGEPSVLLFEAAEEVSGGVYFPAGRFARVAIEKLGHGLLEVLRAMVTNPERRVSEVLAR